jgi:hypothetical protein
LLFSIHFFFSQLFFEVLGFWAFWRAKNVPPTSSTGFVRHSTTARARTTTKRARGRE